MPGYKKNLGLAELVSFGIGGTIGSGIFVVPGIVAGLAGPSSILAWVLAAVSAGCVMLSLAWASSRYPGTGALYPIFLGVFGRRLSTSLVLLYLISSIFGIATIAAGIGQYVSFFGYSNLLWLEIGMVAVFGIINISGVRPSGSIENVLTLMKTLPLILLAIILVPHIRTGNFTPFFGDSNTDFLRSVIIVYWCFTGFEISAIPADEIRNRNDVSRALVIVMAVVTAVYILLNISLIGSVGSVVLASSPAPLAAAASTVAAGSGDAMAVLGIISMISALNAYIMAGSRVLQNISSENRIRMLSGIGSSGTPHIATIVCAASGGALLLFSDKFGELAILSVVFNLLPYMFICVAAVRMFDSWQVRSVGIIGLISTAVVMLSYLL
ncbi:MAG TPA: amino acid permease [Candidatus Methanoperedenaceae archaeon]|nr:amino acid permease [Candidatus Methanoperedenaceae archaeon]